MTGIKSTLLLLVFCLLSQPAPAIENVRFDLLSVRDGLSQNFVNCIYQDRQGFLWIGTQMGLNKFNGYNFEVFTYSPYDSNSLSENYITSIHEDRQDCLWIGTLQRGVNRYNQESKKFERFTADPGTPNGLPHNRIEEIIEDNEGVVWISTRRGIAFYDTKKNGFVSPPFNFIDTRSRCLIYKDKTGEIWLFQKNALTHISRDCISTYTAPFRIPLIDSLMSDTKGNIWIVGDKLTLFNGENKTWKQYRIPESFETTGRHSNIYSISEQKEGELWLATDFSGLLHFDTEREYFTSYFHDSRDESSLSHNHCRAVFTDRSGILWVGTWGGGINKWAPEKRKFTHIKHNPLNPGSLNCNHVFALFEDRDGILWIGTETGGINRYDRNRRAFSHFLHNPRNRRSIASNYVRSIFQDHEGVFWVGIYSGGLNRFDPDKGMFELMNAIPNPEKNGGIVVTSIYEDSRNELWIATYGDGMIRYPAERGVPTVYQNEPDSPHSLSSDRVWPILEDRDGSMWIGTHGGGLNRMNPKNGKFERFLHDPLDTGSLSSNNVTSLCLSRNGDLWVGTFGGGINRLIREELRFRHYTENNGLPDNAVYGILEDGMGRLWISTNYGLSRFSPENGKFTNYDISDGIQDYEFNNLASFKSRSGEMFFGGINGFNSFFPEHIMENRNIPPIVITNLTLFENGKKRDISTHGKKRVELSYKQNTFSIEFAALDFTSPEKNLYSYKIKELHPQWINLGNRRELVFSDINPGKYKLLIKGTNNDGVWNETPASLTLHIVPPFWKTRWFKWTIVFLLLMVFSLIALFTYKHIRLLKEKSRAESFAAVGRFAAYFAHDIKSPLEGTYLIASELNTLISPEDNKKEYFAEVLRGIEKIRNLVKDSLDFSRVKHPKRESINLVSLIEEAALDFEKAIPCSFDLRLHRDIPRILIDKSLFQRVFRNLFENSYQARRMECKIRIETEMRGDTILIRVIDNGKGIEKEILARVFEPFISGSDRGQGFGLAFVRETIKSHNGRIEVQSSPETGTTISILLPIQTARKKGDHE